MAPPRKHPDERSDATRYLQLDSTRHRMALALRAAIEERHLNQAEYARLVGVNPATVSRVLGGLMPLRDPDAWAGVLGLAWKVSLAPVDSDGSLDR